MGRDRIEDDGYGGRFRRPLHRREQLAKSLGTQALPDVPPETIGSADTEPTVLHELDLSEEELASYADYSEEALGDSPETSVT